MADSAGIVEQGPADFVAVLRDPDALARFDALRIDAVLGLLRRSGLLARTAHALHRDRRLEHLPGAIGDQLSSALVVAEARQRMARWELDRLAWALQDSRDVSLVAMKGCAYLLAGTPNSQGRLFADVDLLVPELDLPEVEQRLRSRGWRSAQLTPYDDRYYRRWTHELPPLTHVERSVEIDLHRGILMSTARLKPSAQLLFAAAREVPGSRYGVLAPADMVLNAITHLFYGGEMDGAVRELVDIDDLLRHFGAIEPGFWDGFWSRAERLDLARPAFYGLRYARALLGTPVPPDLLDASGAGAPPASVVAIMDKLVPRVLFPRPLGQRSRATASARWLAYVRSHWVKMRPAMLGRHLAYKFFVRHVKRTAPAVPAGR